MHTQTVHLMSNYIWAVLTCFFPSAFNAISAHYRGMNMQMLNKA